MNTIKKEIISPFRVEMLGIKNRNQMLEQEMKKHVGVYNFSAEFRRDTQESERFKNIPGFISFSCELKRDGRTVAYGRGSSVLNSASKFIERTVRIAKNYSLIDAIMQSTKVMDSFSPNQGISTAPSSDEASLASDRQKKFLSGLIKKIPSAEKREKELSQINSLSRNEASEKIKSLLGGT